MNEQHFSKLNDYEKQQDLLHLLFKKQKFRNIGQAKRITFTDNKVATKSLIPY